MSINRNSELLKKFGSLQQQRLNEQQNRRIVIIILSFGLIFTLLGGVIGYLVNNTQSLSFFKQNLALKTQSSISSLNKLEDLNDWIRFNRDAFLKYNNTISVAAFKNNLDPDLIRAVILIESGFNPQAISPVGARGLMQLMPETAKDMGVRDISDPKENIHGGSKYLRLMLKMHNERLDLALAAYNAGPGAVQKYGGIPPFKETREYVQKVKKAYSLLQMRQ